MILYYSGCGNSRYVAEKLSASLNERLVFIPKAARAGEYDIHLEPGEKLGFVWPVYCWAPPQLVLDYVSKLRVSGAGYVYLVMTYGDNAGLTEKVFRKALADVGLSLDAAWGVQMPETYIQMAGMNLDTDAGAEKKIRAAENRVESIAEAVMAGVSCSDVEVGSTPWLKTAVVKPLFYKLMVTDRKWNVNDSCIACGKCAQVCPLENITLEDGRPLWHGNCTSCNACYHSCPVNAIHFGKATIGKGQYRIDKFLK